MAKINVKVMRRSDSDGEKRRFYYCWWIDPVTGNKCTRTTKTSIRRKADRFAEKLQIQLNSGQGRYPENLTWKSLRERFTREHLDALAVNTRKKADAALNTLERMVNPKYAKSLTEGVLSQWQASLREKGLSPQTVKGYLTEVNRILRWARKKRLLRRSPRIEMPHRLGGTTSRDVTGEEFDRMLAVLPKAVGPDGASSWAFLLRGLWLSGLRREEAMNLHWTEDRKMMVDMTGRHVMLRIQAGAQKSGEFQLLPLAPEFQEFLRSVPAANRRGYVFNPRPLREPFDVRLSVAWVGKKIGQIGKDAGVVVAESNYLGRSRKKYATSHDLRRAFGQRWASRVMPRVLQLLMRHESIETTMKFYMRKDAEETADAAKRAAGATLGATAHVSPPEEASPAIGLP